MSEDTKKLWLERAQNVLTIEADAVKAQQKNLDDNFIQACHDILNCQGHLIITGMGKSGHIGAKVAATFASTGTPAFFVHPAESGHGDLGMITKNDLLLAISYSGESLEIMTMIPLVQAMGAKVITLTGRPESSMAKAANIHLQLSITREACPLGLAPTSSTTATLALCDALAVVVMQARDFSSQDFARSHPFGRLGKRLITKVRHVMRQGEQIPISKKSDPIQSALFQITSKNLGLTLICENQSLLGIYTDGDLRRSLSQNENALKEPIASHMTQNPISTNPETLAAEALQLMQEKKISALPVLENNKLVGILHIHDLLNAGVA